MDNCYFPRCYCNHMGKHFDYDIGSGYNWPGCDNGRNSPFTGVLFHNAVVEDTVAKLKYVSLTLSVRMLKFPFLIILSH